MGRWPDAGRGPFVWFVWFVVQWRGHDLFGFMSRLPGHEKGAGLEVPRQCSLRGGTQDRGAGRGRWGRQYFTRTPK